jgi:hypothetical protein
MWADIVAGKTGRTAGGLGRRERDAGGTGYGRDSISPSTVVTDRSITTSSTACPLHCAAHSVCSSYLSRSGFFHRLTRLTACPVCSPRVVDQTRRSSFFHRLTRLTACSSALRGLWIRHADHTSSTGSLA